MVKLGPDKIQIIKEIHYMNAWTSIHKRCFQSAEETCFSTEEWGKHFLNPGVLGTVKKKKCRHCLGTKIITELSRVHKIFKYTELKIWDIGVGTDTKRKYPGKDALVEKINSNLKAL